MKKLAIVITHPIQYYAPWFKLLAERGNVQLKVFYTWSQAAETVKDKTFGRDIKWDIPLLEGYDYEFVENVSKKPGSHHFFGMDCPSLIPKLKDFSPDAILFFGWNFKSHLKAMRYFHGRIPVWFRGDSTLLDETGGFKTKLRRLVLKTVYRYVDKAFYVGKANKAYFLKHGLKETQLIKTPHAIDNIRFDEDSDKKYEEKAKQWREELGYKEQDILLVYAGKLESVKQIQLLIDAFKIAIKKIHNVKLLIVGNGPLESNLKASASKIDKIQFLPFQNQTKMPLLYRMSNVFCLTSKSETWGLAVNEAMASSRPVIVSNRVGCAADMVLDKKNGFIFNHSDRQELAAIIENLTLEKLNDMKPEAYKTALKFSFLNIVKTIENQLDEIYA
ncbi:glycosyltransferase family 4 protein [Winogradskyella forsetii]|uniref:glycosyltransferase family 4 protein n=1 Tax=Winogradskyella forsetii TaxID=2686077 RepID=UPI0015BF3854|nr:glycosyltransferase family 4 protein [Winogradskyella forsetii]